MTTHLYLLLAFMMGQVYWQPDRLDRRCHQLTAEPTLSPSKRARSQLCLLKKQIPSVWPQAVLTPHTFTMAPLTITFKIGSKSTYCIQVMSSTSDSLRGQKGSEHYKRYSKQCITCARLWDLLYVYYVTVCRLFFSLYLCVTAKSMYPLDSHACFHATVRCFSILNQIRVKISGCNVSIRNSMSEINLALLFSSFFAVIVLPSYCRTLK